MKVTVAALGNIRQFLPEAKAIELDQPVSLVELKEIAGIPADKIVTFMVNGQVQKGDYRVADGDQVKFLMIVGAG